MRHWIDDLSDFFEERKIKPLKAFLICSLYITHKLWQMEAHMDSDDDTPISRIIL